MNPIYFVRGASLSDNAYNRYKFQILVVFAVLA